MTWPASHFLFDLVWFGVLNSLSPSHAANHTHYAVFLADPTNNEAKMKLAQIHEILGNKEGFEVGLSIPAKRAKSPLVLPLEPPSPSPQPPKTQPSPPCSPKEREGVRKCCAVWAGMLREAMGMGQESKAMREWMMEAEKLIDMFRETKNLFLTSRKYVADELAMYVNSQIPWLACPRSRMRRRIETEADGDRMVHRLQRNIEQDTLARRNTKSAGVAVCRVMPHSDEIRSTQCRRRNSAAHHGIKCTPTTRPAKFNSSRIGCSILAKRPDVVVEQARKFITTHQSTIGYSGPSSSLASVLKLMDSFIASTLKEALFTEMKVSDTAVQNPGILRWNGLNRRYAATAIT
ncbi:hypothetical protein BJ165DRAFT_1407029 [Panaeolus papilionaceus]|nr:hypothetical protein BJ165DRAFT_1407029 [Panaeolus papilionaceus]